MRTVWIAMRIAPGKVRRTRDGNLALQQFVVGFQVVIGNGPVRSHAVFGIYAEIRRMEARRECRPMHRSAADSFSAVIFTKRQRMLAARNPQIGPVQLVRSLFVADPVAFRIPERARFDADDLKAGAR